MHVIMIPCNIIHQHVILKTCQTNLQLYIFGARLFTLSSDQACDSAEVFKTFKQFRTWVWGRGGGITKKFACILLYNLGSPLWTMFQPSSSHQGIFLFLFVHQHHQYCYHIISTQFSAVTEKKQIQGKMLYVIRYTDQNFHLAYRLILVQRPHCEKVQGPGGIRVIPEQTE